MAKQNQTNNENHIETPAILSSSVISAWLNNVYGVCPSELKDHLTDTVLAANIVATEASDDMLRTMCDEAIAKLGLVRVVATASNVKGVAVIMKKGNPQSCVDPKNGHLPERWFYFEHLFSYKQEPNETVVFFCKPSYLAGKLVGFETQSSSKAGKAPAKLASLKA